MSDNSFLDFYELLVKLAKSFEQKNIIQIKSELESGIIKIYGEKASSSAIAKSGLEEISELAYDTAEHHPYWSFVYNTSEILKIVLEKWDGELTKDELDQISWHIDELKNTSKKFG